MRTIYVLFRMDIADNMVTLLEAYIDKEDAMAELKALEERAKGRRKVWKYFIEECPLIEKEPSVDWEGDLIMFDLLDFKFRKPKFKQAVHFFENGYGVSVIQGEDTYGGMQGLYEMAVIVRAGDKWNISYGANLIHTDGKIRAVDDALGFLTEDAVTHYMFEVSRLPKKE